MLYEKYHQRGHHFQVTPTDLNHMQPPLYHVNTLTVNSVTAHCKALQPVVLEYNSLL